MTTLNATTVIASREESPNAGEHARNVPVRHYRIGAVDVSLRSSVATVAREFDELYKPYRCALPPGDAIETEVTRTRQWPDPRRKYVISTGGEQRFVLSQRRAVLPHIEWALNWHVMTHLAGHYQVHASAVQRGPTGVLFSGDPGSGKSTLAIGLLLRGWKYHSDEFALIDPQALRLHPYPKAICVKKSAYRLLKGLGVPLPAPSWGSMLSIGRGFMSYAPWYPIFPGLAIMLLVLGVYLLGDGLRDVLDPRRQKTIL